MVSSKGKIFYAEATKGYILKVMIDSLALPMGRTVFEVNSNGFFHRGIDELGHILFDVDFPSENFKKYISKKPIAFSLNLKHLQKMVRNVKKKDSIIMFIDNEDQNKFALAIRPSGATPERNSRIETVYITIAMVTDQKKITLPDTEYQGVYLRPMVVEASEFQKMKKMTTVGKNVKVAIRGSNYISFESDMGICGTKLEFGDEDDENDEEEGVKIYAEEFFMKTFSYLMKLPGLCSQMQFYSPTIKRYPLKVSMMAGCLGKINVYIKDIHQISFEETEKKET